MRFSDSPMSAGCLQPGAFRPGIKQHVIGLCGWAGTGKDTVADLLVAHAGFRKVAFADALRSEAAEAFHVERLCFVRRELKELPMRELAIARCTDQAFVGAALTHLAAIEPGVCAIHQLETPRTPRWILQVWGTQYRRAQRDDYWTAQVRDTIAFFRRECGEQRFILPDVRFANEAETVRGLGAGQLWQVTRPGINGRSTTEGKHDSATDGSEFAPEIVISNRHDIRHLQQIVMGEFWQLDSGLRITHVEIAA